MTRLLVQTLCLSAIVFVPAVCRASEPKRPNIVFILADDLGYRELGCFGQEKIRTPNLDQLAKDGMRLTQHYSGNAVCAPSRCVLMTGRHPGHAAIRDNREMKPEGQTPLPESEVTVAELLQSLGYSTGAFGKWGLGGPGSEGDPLNQGFDQFFGYNCQRHAHSYYPDYLWSNDKRVPLKNSPAIAGHGKLAPEADPQDAKSYAPFKGQEYAPDRIREEAVQFLRDNREQPFFLYYPAVLPHLALHVPDSSLAPYLELGWNDPPFTAAKGGYTPHISPRAAYAAMISQLDSDVGVLLKTLKELMLDENTIVIFSSDNGTTHVNQEVDASFFKSVGELRGLKGSLYEGGVRVPAIVRWPGHVQAGASSDCLSGFEDWMPTILEAVGASEVTPSSGDGVSLIPALTGQPQPDRQFLYREFPGYGGQQSIRMGEWKAIRQNMNQGNVAIELYQLPGDVGETKNVASQHPDIVAQLSEMMAKVREPSNTFPMKPFDLKSTGPSK